MKAWVVPEYGRWQDVLQWQDIPAPQPQGDQALIQVAAAGVNFADMLCIAGTYQVKTPVPFTPGFEAVGTVTARGPDSSLQIGQRVVGFNFHGAFAEQMLVPGAFTFPTPATIPDEHAAGLTVTYQTSYLALRHRADLQPGETLLIHGAAGGVGTTAIQIGKALGATVIATASDAAKLELCRSLGADHTINYREQDFVNVVKEITDGRGADVIFEQVGGETFHRSTKCIAFEGRILVIGFTSGTIPEVATNRILLKNISIVGLNWPNYQYHRPEVLAQAQQELYKLYAAGKIPPSIERIDSLDQLPQALDDLENRRAKGKIVLKV